MDQITGQHIQPTHMPMKTKASMIITVYVCPYMEFLYVKRVQNYEPEYTIKTKRCTIPHCSQQYCWSTAAGTRVTPTAVLHPLASSSTCNIRLCHTAHFVIYINLSLQRKANWKGWSVKHEHISDQFACFHMIRLLQRCEKCGLQQCSDTIMFNRIIFASLHLDRMKTWNTTLYPQVVDFYNILLVTHEFNE
jgi:hypothetical protein